MSQCMDCPPKKLAVVERGSTVIMRQAMRGKTREVIHKKLLVQIDSITARIDSSPCVKFREYSNLILYFILYSSVLFYR